MITENVNGGIFIRFESPVCLSDEAKQKLLDKWEMANEEGEVDDLIGEAETLASPKAYIKPAEIEEIGEDYAVMNGIRFTSVLLADKLAPMHASGEKVYFHLSTCGMELHEWAVNNDDILLRGVAEDICLAYLGIAASAMRAYIEENFYPGRHFSSMNPGSLAAWDIRGQIPTFELLGEGAEKCGVSLGQSMLMTPFKSGSGVYFPTEHDFESCMFCDKLDCPNRRAEYIMQYNTAENA